MESKCNNLECSFFMFYCFEGEKIEGSRICASCLGNAKIVAEEIGKMTNAAIIGVGKELGVKSKEIDGRVH